MGLEEKLKSDKISDHSESYRGVAPMIVAFAARVNLSLHELNIFKRR